MKYIYSFFAVLGILVGLFFWARAENVMNQLEALIIWLSAAVLMVAAEVCEVTSELRRARKNQTIADETNKEPVITNEMAEKFSTRLNSK